MKIAERGEGGVGEHEEHHQRAMHREQREIIFRRDDAARSAGFRKQFEAGNSRRRPDKVETHQPGKHHAHANGQETKGVVLLSDHFVIEAKDVLAEESLRRCMNVRLLG